MKTVSKMKREFISRDSSELLRVIERLANRYKDMGNAEAEAVKVLENMRENWIGFLYKD